jgi:sugar (pentulose or hexulose) kinase
MAYRRCLEQLETITARRFETIHIVGGGCKNALLCQLTADATGRRVLAGPVEATAAGNVLVQATSRAEAPGGLSAIRAISAQSFDVLEYTPRDAQRWDAEYRRHAALWMNSR